MTVMTTMIGLAPVMWSTGAGSDVMRRIAAPMVGGLVTSFLLELTVYPAIFAIWKGFELRFGHRNGPPVAAVIEVTNDEGQPS
jgi:Cu/Ag efflux pump CusA